MRGALNSLEDWKPVRPAGCPSALRLDRWRAGELDNAQGLQLETHVAHCPHCKTIPPALDRLQVAFLEAHPPALVVPALNDLAAQNTGVWARLRAWLDALLHAPTQLRVAGTFAALLLVVWALLPTTDQENGYIGARSGGEVAVDAFLQRAGTVTRVQPRQRLQAGDQIQLQVHTSGKAFLQVVGIDATGQVSPYFPASGPSLPTGGEAQLLLPQAIVLDDYRGLERLFVVLTDVPIDSSLVVSAAARGIEQSRLEDLERLPLDGASQASLLWVKE